MFEFLKNFKTMRQVEPTIVRKGRERPKNQNKVFKKPKKL